MDRDALVTGLAGVREVPHVPLGMQTEERHEAATLLGQTRAHLFARLLP